MSVFENWVLRKIFGPKSDEVTRSGEHYTMRSFMISTAHVACMRERRGVYRILVGKPEGKRLLRKPRHKWEDNI